VLKASNRVAGLKSKSSCTNSQQNHNNSLTTTERVAALSVCCKLTSYNHDEPQCLNQAGCKCQQHDSSRVDLLQHSCSHNTNNSKPCVAVIYFSFPWQGYSATTGILHQVPVSNCSSCQQIQACLTQPIDPGNHTIKLWYIHVKPAAAVGCTEKPNQHIQQLQTTVTAAACKHTTALLHLQVHQAPCRTTALRTQHTHRAHRSSCGTAVSCCHSCYCPVANSHS
jgi:hypothetical protein